ncbi:hypervirulence associated TUDOR domain-containing protein [Roseivivax sp. CAU 1753]
MGLATGDRVEWDWGDGTAKGEIVERFTQDVTRTIKGTEVSRDASVNEPAFLIEQDDGDRVLKSVTEIRRA